MPDGYLIAVAVTMQLILFGALLSALYSTHRYTGWPSRAGWRTLELSGVVGRADLHPGRGQVVHSITEALGGSDQADLVNEKRFCRRPGRIAFFYKKHFLYFVSPMA